MKKSKTRSLRARLITRTTLHSLLITACSVGFVNAQTAQEGVALRSNGASPANSPKQAAPAKAQSNAKLGGRGAFANSAPRCTGEIASPGKLTLQVGKSTIVRLPEPITNRTVGNTDVVQAMLVSQQTLYLLGVDVGTTNMILQGKSGTCSALDVMVGMDTAGLQATFGALMAEEKDIKVTAAADTLVLSGTVADATAVSRAMELASAFVRRPTTAIDSGAGQQDDEKVGASGSASGGRSGGQNQGGGQPRIVNLLNITAPQQVMLEVKIAEVSKTLLDELGVRTGARASSGSWTYSILSNFLSGTASGLLDATKSNGNQLQIEAEKRDGLVRILAEPNVMAISGQEGSFLAGGTILIPVSQSNNNGIPTIGLEEKDFGVGLKFTPTVLSGGRINLRVAPEVSELSREGVGITATGVSGSSLLPLITTRRAATTVQLRDGQSFAIGGLIKNNVTANIRALPVLGEVPILGALFRSTDFQSEKTELLFIVTPRLVKPLPADYALPTDNLNEPSRGELFLNGKLEGKAPVPVSVQPGDAVSPQSASPAGFEMN